jgi:SAM-dependent methyltransferase
MDLRLTSPTIPNMAPFGSRILSLALALGLVLILTRQCRKPMWGLGRLFLWIMNRSHQAVTAWGLKHLSLEKDFTVLDVGCGGGKTLHTLATLASEGAVYGIDHSAESVAASRRTNRAAIAANRVDVRQGTVSHLPFPDGMFDVVTAVETHYYWPNPGADLHEIQRVMKPGGALLIVAETYRGRRFDALYLPAMKLLRAMYLTPDEHKDLLSTAGYSDVAVFEERKKGWLCAVGRKPPIVSPVPGRGVANT